MLYSKLSWLPPYVTALSFDESHYLARTDDDTFDPGTGDFNFSCIFYVAADIGDTTYRKLLLGKGPFNMNSDIGWWLSYLPANKYITLRVNDGNASQLDIDTAVDSFLLGEWYWVHVNVDRSGNVDIWRGRFSTGVFDLVKSGDVSARPGTWSNSNDLWMGNWGATASRYLKGNLGLARIDIGRVIPDDWLAAEWDRIRYGYPHNVGDFTALWEFQNSLVDSSAGAYTMVYTGGGSPSYVDGAPYNNGAIELLLSKGKIKFADGETEVEAMDSARTIDGTSNTSTLFTKKIITKDFEGLSLAEITALRAAYAAGNLIDFYHDSLSPRSFQGMMLTPPSYQEITPDLFEGSFELEEA